MRRAWEGFRIGVDLQGRQRGREEDGKIKRKKRRCTGLENTGRKKTKNHSLLAAYLFSFRVLLDILRQLSHTKLVVEEAERKHVSN